MGDEVAVGELRKTAAEGMHTAVGAVADTADTNTVDQADHM